MKRQAMRITTRQLRYLCDILDEQIDCSYIDESDKDLVKWQIDIVNPEPKCSDTWIICPELFEVKE